VIPHEAVDECLTRARARAEREEVKRAVLRSGALTMDIDGLRQRLIDLGVEFLDESPPPP